MQEAQVGSLVKELRPHKLHGMSKKKKKLIMLVVISWWAVIGYFYFPQFYVSVLSDIANQFSTINFVNTF